MIMLLLSTVPAAARDPWCPKDVPQPNSACESTPALERCGYDKLCQTYGEVTTCTNTTWAECVVSIEGSPSATSALDILDTLDAPRWAAPRKFKWRISRAAVAPRPSPSPSPSPSPPYDYDYTLNIDHDYDSLKYDNEIFDSDFEYEYDLAISPSPSPSPSPLPLLAIASVYEQVIASSRRDYDGLAILLIVALLISIPILGTMYVAARHGAGKVPLWFKLHLSHSNPNIVWFHLSAEERCAMRQKLCGCKGDALQATEPVSDESLGPARRHPGPLLPTSAPPTYVATIAVAQTWLEKAEDDAVRSSC